MSERSAALCSGHARSSRGECSMHLTRRHQRRCAELDASPSRGGRYRKWSNTPVAGRSGNSPPGKAADWNLIYRPQIAGFRGIAGFGLAAEPAGSVKIRYAVARGGELPGLPADTVIKVFPVFWVHHTASATISVDDGFSREK